MIENNGEPTPKFKVGDRVRGKVSGQTGTVIRVNPKSGYVEATRDGDGGFLAGPPDYIELIKEDEMKGKKMYRVVTGGDEWRWVRTQAETELEAIWLSTFTDGDESIESKARQWEIDKDCGYSVEEFYIDDKPEIDWEDVIIRCMRQERWGRYNECSFCRAVGSGAGSAGGYRCGACLFTEYLKENPGAIKSPDAHHPCLQTVNKVGHKYPLTAENFPPVLADMLCWYRKKRIRSWK